MSMLIFDSAVAGRTRFDLGRDDVVVGRSHCCDLFLNVPAVSRRHARIFPTGDGYIVEDLGSANGTHVNGRRCDRLLLIDGDFITFGSILATFKDEDAPVANNPALHNALYGYAQAATAVAVQGCRDFRSHDGPSRYRARSVRVPPHRPTYHEVCNTQPIGRRDLLPASENWQPNRATDLRRKCVCYAGGVVRRFRPGACFCPICGGRLKNSGFGAFWTHFVGS